MVYALEVIVQWTNMKSTKVFFNGKRLKDIYPHATAWQVFKYKVRRFVRKCILVAVIALTIFGVFKLGGFFHPKTVVEVKEVTVDTITPVLKRIADAESLNSHYCTDVLIKAKMCASGEKGQVIFNPNKNGTVDVGRYQINTYYWGAKASELGLDLTDEQDNETMAIWIYKNHGTEPWYASSKKW